MSFDLSDIPSPILDLAVDGARALVKLVWEKLGGDDDSEALDRIRQATVRAAGEAAFAELQEKIAEAQFSEKLDEMVELVNAIAAKVIAQIENPMPLPGIEPLFEGGTQVEIAEPNREGKWVPMLIPLDGDK